MPDHIENKVLELPKEKIIEAFDPQDYSEDFNPQDQMKTATKKKRNRRKARNSKKTQLVQLFTLIKTFVDHNKK